MDSTTNLTSQVSLAYGLGLLAVGGVLAMPVSGTDVTHVSSVSDPVTMADPLQTTSSATPELALLLLGTAALLFALLKADASDK